MDSENNGEQSFGDKLLSLMVVAKAEKETASNSDSARCWAVVRTDLEKVFAYYHTYLKDADKIVEGGS